MGMIIDGIAASQHLDSSGEILDITGHDISDLVEGRGVLNFEHNNDHSEDIIGHIIYAKKIMSYEDAEDDRQKTYWSLCKAPFVYIQAELFDDEHHPGAVAAAALIRYYHKRKMKVLAGFSIEGATLYRQDHVLKRSVGRRVALTLRPCNKSAVSDVLSDRASDQAVKKYMNIGVDDSNPVFEVDSVIFSDIEKHGMSPLNELRKAVADLEKTLTAGSYNAPPSSLTQGAALQVEDRTRGLSPDAKKRLKSVIKKWDGKRPLKEVLKADLPDVSDDYIDHFASMVDDIKLKKKEPLDAIRLSPNPEADFLQVRMIEGIDLGCLSHCVGSVVKTKSDQCDSVLLKIPSPNNPLGAVNATRYYEVARDFFGLGGCVVPTNFIRTSGFSQAIEVTELDPQMQTIESPDNSKAFDEARQSGLLQKIILMDLICGNDKGRHWASFISRKGKLMVTDNSRAFRFDGTDYPGYTKDSRDLAGVAKDLVDLRVIAWVIALDPRTLAEVFSKHVFGRDVIKQSVSRLTAIQESIKEAKTVSDLFDLVVNKDENI